MADCTKIKYASHGVAVYNLRVIVAKYAGRKPKVPVAVYVCADCHAWHLTSKKPSGVKRNGLLAAH